MDFSCHRHNIAAFAAGSRTEVTMNNDPEDARAKARPGSLVSLASCKCNEQDSPILRVVDVVATPSGLDRNSL